MSLWYIMSGLKGCTFAEQILKVDKTTAANPMFWFGSNTIEINTPPPPPLIYLLLKIEFLLCKF